MSSTPIRGGLQIEDDVRFQYLNWRLERAGWALMALVLLAALLGVFGDGPLARAQQSDPAAGVRVAYARFARAQNVGQLRLHLDAAPGQRLPVRLDAGLLAGVRVEQVTPPPVAVEAGAQAHTYFFQPAAAGEPVTVEFLVRYESWGLLAGSIQAGEARPLALRTVVYP